MAVPFAKGSVSLRIYPHGELDATAIVDELRAQAALAIDAGFDGVMTSEHHGGFAGYLPNPLQVSGWMLDAMGRGWAAACPLLLPLRPAALVAEEVAWLAARFPGRVGVGVAAGGRPDDFAALGVPIHDLAARFADGLATLTALLGGRDAGALAGDAALARCAEHPVPVVSAAMGFTAARRAAAHGAGLLFDSLSAIERVGALVDAYRDAGGAGPCVLIRRVWLGPLPGELFDDQVGVYRAYSSASAQSHWRDDQVASDAAALLDALARSGADALNLRLHVPGVSPAAAREQIAALSRDVLPRLRAAGW